MLKGKVLLNLFLKMKNNITKKKKNSLLICVVLFSWLVGNLFFSNKFCQS